MKYLLLLIALGPISSGGYDLITGESTLHYKQSRTVTRQADAQEYYGFIGIKVFAGYCCIGLYRLINKDEDNWY